MTGVLFTPERDNMTEKQHFVEVSEEIQCPVLQGFVGIEVIDELDGLWVGSWKHRGERSCLIRCDNMIERLEPFTRFEIVEMSNNGQGAWIRLRVHAKKGCKECGDHCVVLKGEIEECLACGRSWPAES